MTAARQTTPVEIRAEPLDDVRCRFEVDRPLYPDRWIYFDRPGAASGAALAERLFRVEGVSAVLIAHQTVTVTRPRPGGMPIVRVVRALVGGGGASAAGWKDLARRVGAAIRAHLDSGEPAVGHPPPFAVPTAAELRARVQRVLDDDVNPVIAGHGGGVTILDVIDNVVYLQMWGGCQGCGLRDMTLKNGVEAAVRDAVPEIGAIHDLTDHAAGLNPYRRPAPG